MARRWRWQKGRQDGEPAASPLARRVGADVLFLAGIAGFAVGHGYHLQDTGRKPCLKVTGDTRMGAAGRLPSSTSLASSPEPFQLSWAAFSLACKARPIGWPRKLMHALSFSDPRFGGEWHKDGGRRAWRGRSGGRRHVW